MVVRWREFFRGSVQPCMCRALTLICAKQFVQQGSLEVLRPVCGGIELFQAGACSHRSPIQGCAFAFQDGIEGGQQVSQLVFWQVVVRGIGLQDWG